MEQNQKYWLSRVLIFTPGVKNGCKNWQQHETLCFVLMPLGIKTDESSDMVEHILEDNGAPYTTGRPPGWKQNQII